MIQDEILFMVREYRDLNRGNPSVLYITPDDYAQLIEELDIKVESSFERYAGMDLEIVHDSDTSYVDAY